jgi:hypothetical protein
MSKGAYDFPLEHAQRIYWFLRCSGQEADEAIILAERVKCHCEHIAERVLTGGNLGGLDDDGPDDELMHLSRLDETIECAEKAIGQLEAVIFDLYGAIAAWQDSEGSEEKKEE